MSNHEYEIFRDSLKIDKQAPLFTTDVADLFTIFLNNLPAEHRQHYTCNSCRRFVERYGGLVTISESGKQSSAIWPVVSATPVFFRNAVESMRSAIHAAQVTGVFYDSSATWGTPVTGEWTHFAIRQAPAYRHTLKSAHQAMAEKHEDHVMLGRSLADYGLDTAEKLLALLNSEQLYRGDRVLGIATWYESVLRGQQAARGKAKANLLWLAVATAPAGFCHVRSSVIGTVLDDLKSGLSVEVVKRNFADKMNPSQYQRAQVAPTVGNVQQAEKLVEKLGLQLSLQRRYLSIGEIPEFIWRPQPGNGSMPNGVFGHIATKLKAAVSPALELPVTTMTWAKFQRAVLPTATKIEVKLENTDRFGALVTAQHPEAPNILQWDNVVSWYYHSGIDVEMKRRVEQAGGRYEGNEIRATLAWDSYTDLDLHCEGPAGHIYYRDKRDRASGWLDVDANGGTPTTTAPVENIRWQSAPVGHYRFYVHNYYDRDRGYNPYRAELEVLGKVYSFQGVLHGTGERHDLVSFHYQRGVAPAIHGNAVQSNGEAWGLATNQFHPVTGVVKSPNLWGGNPVERVGDHTFFLIDGCKDSTEGKGRGFFNEMLKPELREIRKTLEAYTANTPIADNETATACGLGFSKDGEWNVTLRVTSGSVVGLYKVDRWD